MALSSMTGFARVEGAHEQWRWTWELKSVNGRNLELRFRLPGGHDWLEAEARKAVQGAMGRGSVHAGLMLAREAGTQSIQINQEALAQIIAAMDEIKQKTGAAPPTLDGILSLRGILEVSESEETTEEREARGTAILTSLKTALDGLIASRQSEGEALQNLIAGHVDEIERLTDEAATLAAARPEALRERIKSQIEVLIENTKGLNEDRLHQELAMLATKADVTEEIDRLKAHVAAARNLIAEDEPVGRRLDFLTQEFNREANTLCSKAGDIELTRVGLELKAVIDQLREQIQNVE